MPDAPSGTDDPQFEPLLAAAIDALEQHGQSGMERLVASHPEHAAALRRSLAELERTGMLTPPPPTGGFPARLGDFRLLERLGGGGMGVVFLAEQESLERRVAVKLVRPELLLSEVARERFQREIEAVSRLQHPGIVPILAVGSDGGIPYFAMEYVPGATLDAVLASLGKRAPRGLQAKDLAGLVDAVEPGRGGSTSTPAGVLLQGTWWEACVRIVLAVAQTMAYVHARGIIHRDLKPSNIVLTRDGRTLLLDFGLAHMQHEQRLTRTGAEVGSPAYMAPEQVRGDALDERTDVYSLGVSLWQMLALEMPFGGASGEQLRQAILAGRKRPLRALNGAVPRELEVVVHTAMELAPGRRYRSMADLAGDLAAVLARRPIAARPLGLHLRLLRWCQRHRAITAALAVAMLLLLAFPLVLLEYQRRANVELDAALATTLRANEQLDHARELAEADYGEALAAIDRMLVRFAFDDLVHVPATQPLRVQLLRDAIAFYDRIVERHPDAVPPRQGRARAQRHLASILRDLGDNPGARAAATAAIAVLRALPPTTDVLLDLTWCHSVLATIACDARQWAECHAELDAAGAAGRDALTRPPQSADLRIAVADVDNLRGLAFGAQGDPAGRDRHLQAALAQKRAIVADWPGNVRATRSLALQLLNVGDAMLARKDPVAAELLREALALVRTVTAPDASTAERALLASIVNKLGLWHRAVGELDAAEPLLQEALQLRTAIARDHRDAPFHVREHAGALYNLGLLRDAQQRFPEAIELAEQAAERLREAARLAPDDPRAIEPRAQILTLRCNLCFKLGRFDALCTAAEELASMTDSPRRAWQAAHHLMQACRLLAKDATLAPADRRTRTSAIEQRALALLADAAARGLGDPQLLDAASFRTLQGRPEFAEVRDRVRQNAARAAEAAVPPAKER